jgi:BASS family bile acid:Na+ symporter
MHLDLYSLERTTPHVLAAIGLAAMMAQLGLLREPELKRREKRKERWLLVWALAFNFVIVPLCALAVARALDARGPLALGLLVLAASPGGRQAPLLARASQGNVPLSVEITLFLNKLNPFLSPLLVAWMMGVHRVELHEVKYIAELLVLQIVPYYGARRMRRARPQLAGRYWRALGLTWGGAGIALLLYLILHHALSAVRLFGARGWLAVLLFGVVLLLLGWLAGGRDPSVRRSFAVVAVTRNLALALVMANLALRDPQVMLAIFAAWLILSLLGAGAALARRSWRSPSSIVPQPS